MALMDCFIGLEVLHGSKDCLIRLGPLHGSKDCLIGLGPLFYVQSAYKAFKLVQHFGSKYMLSIPSPILFQNAPKCIFLLP